MASDNEACCESDPNFAVICGFLEKFGVTCGLTNIDFLDLQDMLENNQEVPQELVDLHVKLLRKARKSVSSERWERAIIKLCHGFCSQDAWEIERFGYKKARLSSKLRILKELLEMQFDYNAKFKNEINKLSAEELRTQPLGRDRVGHVYWFQSDNSCQIRVYKEDPDEETWALVAKDREGLVNLITQLNDGQETVVNEDSNSLESEKPIIDTGQTDSNSNSNSSKQDQASTDTNMEENQPEPYKKVESDGEKPQIDEENITQTNIEEEKSSKMKLRNKKGFVSEDSTRLDESLGNGSNGEGIVEQEYKTESSSEKDEKDTSVATVMPPKPGISIRIKPISELISSASVEVNKKLEITGVKEKYIRTDSSSSSSVHHRKAVDSAGFDVHTNYLKRPIEEEEDVEEPSYIKRPRLDRPTLLGNKKKKPYSDEEEEEDEEVSDDVEEPLMLITGEGSGQDNEGGNLKTPEMGSPNPENDSPVVSEEIEESVIYFYGEGNGHECETGNDNNPDKQDVASQQQRTTPSKTAGAGSVSESSNANSQYTSQESNKADTIDSIKDGDPSGSFDEANCSVKTPTKTEFKLGTIIDVRTSKSVLCTRDPTKKSRWDIGKPGEGFDIESQTNTKESVEGAAADRLSDVNLCNSNSNVKLESENESRGSNLDLPKSPRGKVQELVNQWEKLSTPSQKPKAQKEETIANEVHDSSVSVTSKKSMFFFGPGCLQVKPTISPLKSSISSQPDEKNAEEGHMSKTAGEDHGKAQEILDLNSETNDNDTACISSNLETKTGSFEVTRKTENLPETDSQLTKEVSVELKNSDVKEQPKKSQAQKDVLNADVKDQLGIKQDAQRDDILVPFEDTNAKILKIESSESLEIHSRDAELKIEGVLSNKCASIQDNNLLSVKKDSKTGITSVEQEHIKSDTSKREVQIDPRQKGSLSKEIPISTVVKISKNNDREVEGASEKCDILNLSPVEDKSFINQPETSTSTVLKLGNTGEQEKVDKNCSLPNNVAPANHHVRKNSVNENDLEEIPSHTSGDQEDNKLSDVPVSEKLHTLDASNKMESRIGNAVSTKVAGLPKEVEVTSLNTSVLESKPKSKLEDVQEDIKRVDIQKTDNVDISNKSEDSDFKSSDQTCCIEQQVAMVTSEKLLDPSDSQKEALNDPKVSISSSVNKNRPNTKTIEIPPTSQSIKNHTTTEAIDSVSIFCASNTLGDADTQVVSTVKEVILERSPDKDSKTQPVDEGAKVSSSVEKIVLKESIDVDTSSINKSSELVASSPADTKANPEVETPSSVKKAVLKGSFDGDASSASKPSELVDELPPDTKANLQNEQTPIASPSLKTPSIKESLAGAGRVECPIESLFDHKASDENRVVASAVKKLDEKQSPDAFEVKTSGNTNRPTIDTNSLALAKQSSAGSISDISVATTSDIREIDPVPSGIKKLNEKQSLDKIEVMSSVSKCIINAELLKGQSENVQESLAVKKIDDKLPADKVVASISKPVIDMKLPLMAGDSSGGGLSIKSADENQESPSVKKSGDNQSSDKVEIMAATIGAKSPVATKSNHGSCAVPSEAVKVSEEVHAVTGCLNAKHNVKEAASDKVEGVHGAAAADSGIFRSPDLYHAKKFASSLEKPAIDIDEVIVNATSGLPSSVNKSGDSGIISLTEILSTSEKVPISATKGGINKSSAKKFSVPIITEVFGGSPSVSKQSITKPKGNDEVVVNKISTDVKLSAVAKADATSAVKKSSGQVLDVSEGKTNKKKTEMSKESAAPTDPSIKTPVLDVAVGSAEISRKFPDLPQKHVASTEAVKVTPAVSPEGKKLETGTSTDEPSAETVAASTLAGLAKAKEKCESVDSKDKSSVETKASSVEPSTPAAVSVNKADSSKDKPVETKDLVVKTVSSSVDIKGPIPPVLSKKESLETKRCCESICPKLEVKIDSVPSKDKLSAEIKRSVEFASSVVKSSVETKNLFESAVSKDESSVEEKRSVKLDAPPDKPSTKTKESVESVSSKGKPSIEPTVVENKPSAEAKGLDEFDICKDKPAEDTKSPAESVVSKEEPLEQTKDSAEPIKDKQPVEPEDLVEPILAKGELSTEAKDSMESVLSKNKPSVKARVSAVEPCATDVPVENKSVKSTSASTDDNIPNRRVTRRTRSSTIDKSETVENKNEKSADNKFPTSSKKIEDSDQVSTKKGKKLVVEKSENFSQEKSVDRVEAAEIDDNIGKKSLKANTPDTGKSAKGRGKWRKTRLSKENKDKEQPFDKTENEVRVTGDTNRELRQRKVAETNKNKVDEKGKKKLKGRGRAKAKGNSVGTSKEEKNISTRSQAKDKAAASKSDSSKENIEKSEAADAGIEDIEEQIVRTEIRPSKKLKLSDSIEVTVVDKNKRTVTTHTSEKTEEAEKAVEQEDSEEKKEPPKTRRSLRSNQPSNTGNSTKSAKDQDEAVGETDELDSDKKGKTDLESQELKPVDEPICIQQKVPLLTCVDINKLKAPCESTEENKSEDQEKAVASPESVVSGGFGGDADAGGDSSDDAVVVVPESDPLACSEEDAPEPVHAPMTMATFKLDVDDLLPMPPMMRVTRKRAAQQSIDALREIPLQGKKTPREKKDEGDSKRPKLKKRSVDRNLRRSIEEQKLKAVSSSEEDDNDEKAQNEPSAKQNSGKKSKSIVKRRISTRSTRATESPAASSDALSEASRTDTSNTPPVTKEKKPRKQKKTLLGLEISEETESLLKNDTPSTVRQSRRIAQLKIKEEAERRKLEEVTLQELKDEQRKRKGKKGEDKDYKMEKRKRNKNIPTEDETTCDAESDEKKKRKRKRKHWDPTKKFDLFKAWKTSSGSSSSEIEDEEEEIEEDDDHHLVIKSDHEFSPESDLEADGEVQPLKRARTARKESDAEEEVDDCACQKCGQKDHPEWILLCDSCDSGWHCSCLRPALLVIPEGDWFCPPCQHITLVKNLEARLHEYDRKINKKEMETRRKERLAYVGISLDNVLPSKELDEHRHKHRHHEDKESGQEEQESGDSDSDESGSDSESSSSSDSDSEPVYQLRERRQAHSYRFNDYDELINSAIQDELEAVKGAGNQGRGKDIATIVNAEKEEAEAQRLKSEAAAAATEVAAADGTAPVAPIDATVLPADAAVAPEATAFEPLPPVVPPNYDAKPTADDSDNEPIRPVKKIIGKKKHRKLNSLDVSSGDDAESDEDFKGSSSSESEEDFDEDDYSGSESSETETRRGKRRKDFGPVRRSTRARISRYDRDFINDSDSEEEEAPRRKKTRSVWDESESEESDRSWGRRKRKATKSQRRKSSGKIKKSKKKKKKKRTGDDSDPEVYRKRPNIKFGGLNDDEEVGRRTRGKKINYLEALGTDSEEEIRRKPPRIEESEEEYNLHDDEDFQQQLENDKDSDESGVDTVLQDIAKNTQPRPKARGRGKAGLKIPRKPKDAPPPEFPSEIPDLLQLPTELPPAGVEPTTLQPLQSLQPLPTLATQPPPILVEPPTLQEQELQDAEDEPNPIEQINKNVEQMNEQEMEKMMEEEDYANKQLQLVALQIEKEKKRKEREAKRLEKLMEKEQKIPKKRGRKPKSQMLSGNTDLVPPFSESASMLMNSVMANNAELSEPPGVSLPMFSEIAPVLNPDGTPKKRRGRGKGKKTLAAEAAAIAAAASKDNPEMDMSLEGPASSGSNTVSPAPDSPMHGSKLGIAAQPQPFSQSQPTPSVITRMLQSQTGQGTFPGGGSKYFGGLPGDPQLGPPPGTGPYHPGGARGPMPGPYQQPPPTMPHYPVVRSGPAPSHRLHSPGPPGLPPMYHTHRSMDPSPSGGGPINVSTANRDRHSPAIVPPAASSPLTKGDPTPPPPPYTRPQVGHFPPAVSSVAAGPRHVSMVPPHLQQHRASSMSPYHPGVPPNYHYGTYPPPPPLNTDEGQSPPVYPSPAYSEPYPGESGAPVQPSESGKPFDEDTGGEFVGLVSYFSSQREDDLDT